MPPGVIPTHAREKIVQNIEDVTARVKALRKGGHKIVLTQGVFDMIHIGHARYLEEAKHHGDVLIVGVDSDEKVRARKGPDRPVIPEEERTEMLTYLRAVDLVILKKFGAPKFTYIKAIRPDVLITTREWFTPEKVAELKEYCGKIVVLEPMATTSTSAKLRRLQIGTAKKMSERLSNKITAALEEVLQELREM